MATTYLLGALLGALGSHFCVRHDEEVVLLCGRADDGGVAALGVDYEKSMKVLWEM
jgi:hypothetical protein